MAGKFILKYFSTQFIHIIAIAKYFIYIIILCKFELKNKNQNE